ncbi:MAG: radical SAM protein [Firmicutes bacterium]|nr:radical SAM protein [Bacillota bacterium]
MENQIFAYILGESIYLNITNRCTNDCLFCIRRTQEGLGSYDLWLKKEPDLNELMEAAGDIRRFREVVFCGYGEPLVRADLVVAAARVLKVAFQNVEKRCRAAHWPLIREAEAALSRLASFVC